MEENNQDHEAGTPMMNSTDQPTKANPGHDVLDAIVGMVGGGNIINGKHDAGDTLKEK